MSELKGFKTLDEFAINMIEKQAEEIRLMQKKIAEYEQPKESVHSIAEEHVIQDLYLKPTPTKIQRIVVASGYNIRDEVKRGNISKQLVLDALTDDDRLDYLSRKKVKDSWSSGAIIHVTKTTVDYIFKYEDVSYALYNLDSRSSGLIAYNTHQSESQERASGYDSFTSDYYTPEGVETVMPIYLEKLREELKRYEDEIRDIEVDKKEEK